MRALNAPAALDATSRPDLAGAFDARRALRVLGSVVVVGSGLVGLHLITGIGLPCPLLTSLGMYCPFCGSTRAAESVLRGDLAAAWGWNPILLIALVVTGLAAIAWTVEVAGGPALRPPSIIRPLTQTKGLCRCGCAVDHVHDCAQHLVSLTFIRKCDLAEALANPGPTPTRR